MPAPGGPRRRWARGLSAAVALARLAPSAFLSLPRLWPIWARDPYEDSSPQARESADCWHPRWFRPCVAERALV